MQFEAPRQYSQHRPSYGSYLGISPLQNMYGQKPSQHIILPVYQNKINDSHVCYTRKIDKTQLIVCHLTSTSNKSFSEGLHIIAQAGPFYKMKTPLILLPWTSHKAFKQVSLFYSLGQLYNVSTKQRPC